MQMREKKPVLLLIDVQQGFQDEAYWGGERNNKDVEAVCGGLLARWRALDLPVIHVRHSSADPNAILHAKQPGFAFHPAVTPQDDERVITKNVNSAFIGTDLKAILDASGATALVIVGLTTDHCVSTTTRMAGNFGYEVFVISDATATFDRVDMDGTKWSADVIHTTALASLKDEFATILTTKTLLEVL